MGATTEVKLGPPPQPLALWRMRWRWSVVALRAQLRRWAAFLVVVAAVLGPFVTTLIGWPALPLFWSVQQPLALTLPVLLLLALPPAALAWGLRECLLPSHWQAAERALPLSPGQVWRADLCVIALAQAPWTLLMAISVASWWHADPAWMQGLWAGMAWRWLATLLLALALTAVQMQGWRRMPAGGGRGGADRSMGRPASVASSARRAGPRTLLLWAPLWRGPARPVLQALIVSLVLQMLLWLALWRWPAQADWVMAMQAVLSMATVSQIHARAQRCYAPLIVASAALPLPPTWWPRGLQATSLAPAFLGWAGLLASLWLGPWALSSAVLPFYLAAGVLAPGWAVRSTVAPPESRAAAWLLPTALWVALATVILK